MANGLVIISAGDDRAIYMAVFITCIAFNVTRLSRGGGKWLPSDWGCQLNDAFAFRVSVTRKRTGCRSLSVALRYIFLLLLVG
jgi:hypothetical protein